MEEAFLWNIQYVLAADHFLGSDDAVAVNQAQEINARGFVGEIKFGGLSRNFLFHHQFAVNIQYLQTGLGGIAVEGATHGSVGGVGEDGQANAAVLRDGASTRCSDRTANPAAEVVLGTVGTHIDIV